MKSETYLYVQFKDNCTQYIYKANGTFDIDDIVEAPTCLGAIKNVAIVKRIRKLADDKLPIAKETILTITKKLDKKEYEKDFHPLQFMKNHMRRDYLKEWKFATENSWVKVYRSNFKGQISYEQDGVLTCSIGNCMDDDFFEQYTITSPQNFDIKFNYVATILSSLYYKTITEQQFEELFKIV